MSLQEKVKNTIRDVADFPKPGIMFKDITPILENPLLCREIVKELCEPFKDFELNAVVGVESRGFLFGMLIAQHFNIPFIPVRKAGKLPYETIQFSYDLEYGSATVEMHVDTIQEDWNVLIHDDLLATGGTAGAAAELIQMQGGKVAGCSFLVELSFLNGRSFLEKYTHQIVNLVEY
jgi:adenine phosphoribosyltransferase